MRKPLYFFVNDVFLRLKSIKKNWLYFIPFIVLGIIVGVIVAFSIEESDLTSSLGSVIAGDFNAFEVFFKYGALLLAYLILVFLSQKRKLFIFLLHLFSIYVGYIIGRVIVLTVKNDGFWGILSLLLFFIPSMIAIIISSILGYTEISGKLNCVFSITQDKAELKSVTLIYLIALVALFILNVVLGGLINLIVNIV